MVVTTSLQTRRDRERTARRRASARVDASLRSVFIGAPSGELFSDSVFNNALQQALRFRPQVTAMDTLREQIIDFVTNNVDGTNNSLDIIADAPSGAQQMPTEDVDVDGTTQARLHPLLDLLKDPSSTVDDDLVNLIKQHFAQCRLLGCVTAVDAPVRSAVKRMAKLLQMPILGTKRTIAYTDFDDIGFTGKRTSKQPGNGTDENPLPLDTITPDSVHGGSGRGANRAHGVDIQQTWLDMLPQVDVTRDHLVSGHHPAIRAWPLPFELIGARLATTDVIYTRPLGITVIQCPSGTSSVAQVLARGTLLRLPANFGSPIYINIPFHDPTRRKWLQESGIDRMLWNKKLR